jgi:hypothetical protein
MQSAMADRQNKKKLKKHLIVLFANPDQLRSANYRQIIDKNRRLVLQLIFDLNQTLTTQQRSKLVKKLKDFVKDFRDLSN